MKKIDIEKLLQWALREELPKGRPVSASPWDAINNFAALGTRVDVSRGPIDGLGFTPGTPHADAEIVAQGLRELPAAARLSEAECIGLIGPYAALDALALRAVAGASFNPRALLVSRAILGMRMEWNIGLPRPAAAVKHDRQRWAVAFLADAEGVLREARANNRGNYPPGAATHVRWCEPSVGQLLETRAEYTVWHRGLCALAILLRDRLADYHALPPAIPAAPWRDGEPAAPPVLTLPGGKLALLPLKPERKVALPPLESDIERRAREWRQNRRQPSRRLKAEKTNNLGFLSRF